MHPDLTPQRPAELKAGVDGAYAFRKRSVIVSVVFARSEGVVATLEGNVRHAVGDAIVTGMHGERWPIARAVFETKYDPLPSTCMGQPGAYRSRPFNVLAKQLTAGTVICAPADKGAFTGLAGDWLVQYAPGDAAIVAREIFNDTYEAVHGPAPAV